MHDIDRMLDDARQRPLVGWDVSYDGRITYTQPWDFTAIVAAQARHSTALLDLGTGGGEWLSRLPNRPANVVATEGWPPNVPIARERLAPLDIELFAVEAAPYNVEQTPTTMIGALPLPDRAFDLVTSRHESYLPHEVKRVMTDDGCFLTQQVASGDPDDFYRLLGWPVPKVDVAWDLAFAAAQLEAAGFVIEQAAEGHEEKHFADIGALAWYLQHMPFVLPDFSIAAAREELLRIAASDEPIMVRQPLFWLKARKA